MMSKIYFLLVLWAASAAALPRKASFEFIYEDALSRNGIAALKAPVSMLLDCA